MSKAIAVIDKPENCQYCVFGVCKYSLPLTKNIKGYYCQLLQPEQRVVQDFDYDADVHLDNCPLRPIPEKKDESCARTMTDLGWIGDWNGCIDAIVGSTRRE